MGDESDENAEKARLDDAAFERLPPAVKLATLLERERKQKKLAANSVHIKNLGVYGALAGSGCFLLAHVILVQNLIALAGVTLAGALAGYVLVYRERSHIAAMLIFAAFAIGGDLLAMSTGAIPPADMVFAFLVWMLLVLAGVLIAAWAKKQRELV
jgi:hypothetical protein